MRPQSDRLRKTKGSLRVSCAAVEGAPKGADVGGDGGVEVGAGGADDADGGGGGVLAVVGVEEKHTT